MKVESLNNSYGDEAQEANAATNNQEMHERDPEPSHEERMARMHMMYEKLGLQKGTICAPGMMSDL